MDIDPNGTTGGKQQFSPDRHLKSKVRNGTLKADGRYLGAKQKTQAEVVSVYQKSKGEGPIDYDRRENRRVSECDRRRV